MKRRDILKGLPMAVSGSLLPWQVQRLFGQQGNHVQALPLATPIRGLVRRDGTLQQPIQISVFHTGPSVVVVTKLDGAVVDRRNVSDGGQSFAVFTSPATAPRNVSVSVTVGETEQTATITLLPVRKVSIYILPHSHHDLGYTDIQPHIEEKQIHNIDLAIDLARQTASYPVGARFVWNQEVLWSADLYMERKSPAEKDKFIDAVKRGWISLNGMYANQLTGLCRPEELMRLFSYSGQLKRQYGVQIDSAMLSDVPGYTWGTITAMSQAGVRYFSAAPNNSDRIGTIRLTWHDKPFWHVSPSGKEKVLVWMPGHGYSTWPAPNGDMVAGSQDFLDSVDYPYDISYIRWAGHGDNAVPDPQICEFAKSWNQEYEWPKFVISSTSEAFSALEKRHGSELPEFRGDLTPYWEDGAGSSALETRINRNSADRLAQAEALAAMLPPGACSSADFNEAWRNVLLYSEHTWGASASVRDPDAPMTTQQWAIKRQFALDGETQSKSLLKGLLHSADASGDTSAIDVFNTSSWPRTEVVLLSKELSSAGDRVTDGENKPVPSQRLSSGELAVLVREVPAFGSARLRISAGKPEAPAMRVAATENTLDNGIVRARIDAQTGNLVEFAIHGKPANLIDTARGGSANEYLFVKGRDFQEIWKTQNEAQGLHSGDYAFDGPDIGSIERSGPARVTIEEQGQLIASLRIESEAPGCNRLIRRVRLVAGADWLELSNLVDKKPAPRNSSPEKANQSGLWSQYGGKESVHFAFPFSIPDGKMRMDIPFGEMQPEVDQLPGSCKNWLPVGRWIDVANDRQGVTWVTLDAPLVEIGETSATLVGSQHNPVLWRDVIAPTQRVYSWAMNNHWETNYCASQEGPVEFRYALRAHGGYDPAAASRFAITLSQPLIPSAARSRTVSAPFLQIEPADVLALTVKPSEDGKAWIVRLFGASGENRTAKLRWSNPAPHKMWVSDLSEAPIRQIGDEVSVAGWEVITLRADRTA